MSEQEKMQGTPMLDEIEAEKAMEQWDDQKADWAIGKIREHQAEIARWRAFYGDRMNRVETSENEQIEWLTAKLRDYFNGCKTHDTKTTRKYALPSGELVLSAQAPMFSRDDEQLTKYMDHHGYDNLVKTIRRPDWMGFKKLCGVNNGNLVDLQTGEIVPGVVVEEREPAFTVKLKEANENE